MAFYILKSFFLVEYSVFPGKSGREIWGFENFPFTGEFTSGSLEIFFHFIGFSGTDIYHSDVKIRLCRVLFIYFLLVKNYFSRFPKFCLGDQKVFSQFVEKCENSNL